MCNDVQLGRRPYPENTEYCVFLDHYLAITFTTPHCALLQNSNRAQIEHTDKRPATLYRRRFAAHDEMSLRAD